MKSSVIALSIHIGPQHRVGSQLKWLPLLQKQPSEWLEGVTEYPIVSMVSPPGLKGPIYSVTNKPAAQNLSRCTIVEISEECVVVEVFGAT